MHDDGTARVTCAARLARQNPNVMQRSCVVTRTAALSRGNLLGANKSTIVMVQVRKQLSASHEGGCKSSRSSGLCSEPLSSVLGAK
jgi:hypothetical protein